MPAIRDLLYALDAQYSFVRAAKWDKVGLLIGDEKADAKKVLVAHEVTDEVLDAATGYDALVVYHPPIFRPLENLNFRDHSVRLAARCIAQHLNVIAVHTALDHATPPHALGDQLAKSLGLQEARVLGPDGCEALCKIVVFVPPEALEKVSEAMWNAGAGSIGNYDRASFRTRGTGTFRPLPGANPYDGEIGQDEEADEWRLEVIVEAPQREAVVAAMKAAHPYEEVAYDIYPLHNTGEAYGSCRIGSLARSTPLATYAARVAEELEAPSTRVVATKDTLQRIACVPGSGASFISAAARAGCDCLVTGDIKHHDALQAKALGISLIDVTHAATERAAVPMLAQALSTLDVEVVQCATETNPFRSKE
jgi:dinuclear metal center YbgI/SA1388 family protein